MGRRAARRCDESRTESQQELSPVHRQPYQSSTAVFGPVFRPTEGTEDTEKASTRRRGETEPICTAAFRADAGPAEVGRAGRSTDSPRPQAASAFTRGLWPRAVGRSLAAQARRHRLHRSFGGPAFSPFALRSSASPFLKLFPFPPSPPLPIRFPCRLQNSHTRSSAFVRANRGRARGSSRAF